MGYYPVRVDTLIVICLGIFYASMRYRDSWIKKIDERLKKLEEK